MGIDLRLYAVEDIQHPTTPFTSLYTERDYRIYSQLADFFSEYKDTYPSPTIQTQPVPPGFVLRSFDYNRKITKDAYDATLTFAWARDLKRLVVPGDADWANKAALAYIKKLPDTVAVVLFWH